MITIKHGGLIVTLDMEKHQTADFTVYLFMAAVCCMMQRCPSRPVGNIQAAHVWYQSFSAACVPLTSCHV